MFATPKPAGSWARLSSHPGVRYTQPSSPWGTVSPFRSVHATFAVVSASGLYEFENPVVPICMYLPALNLIAVF